jgi:osmotically-inducible protein OsmY
VTVDQGVVTLAGTARSYAECVAAQQAAHRVIGMLDVANDLQVELPGDRIRTAADNAQAVRHTLARDPGPGAAVAVHGLSGVDHTRRRPG